MLALNFVDAVLTLFGGAIGAYVGGVIGAAIGCLIGTAVGAAASLGFTVRRLGLPVPASAITKIMLATALMALALSILPSSEDPVGFTRAVLIGSSTYLTAALVLFGDVRRDFVARLQRAT
jgi:hypothetical protein